MKPKSTFALWSNIRKIFKIKIQITCLNPSRSNIENNIHYRSFFSPMISFCAPQCKHTNISLHCSTYSSVKTALAIYPSNNHASKITKRIINLCHEAQTQLLLLPFKLEAASSIRVQTSRSKLKVPTKDLNRD